MFNIDIFTFYFHASISVQKFVRKPFFFFSSFNDNRLPKVWKFGSNLNKFQRWEKAKKVQSKKFTCMEWIDPMMHFPPTLIYWINFEPLDYNTSAHVSRSLGYTFHFVYMNYVSLPVLLLVVWLVSFCLFEKFNFRQCWTMKKNKKTKFFALICKNKHEKNKNCVKDKLLVINFLLAFVFGTIRIIIYYW